MKKLMIFLVLSLVACAPPVPTCTESWACGNSQCASYEGSWSGTNTTSGSDDMAECEAWGYAFVNSTGYPYNRVSSCSCTN